MKKYIIILMILLSCFALTAQAITEEKSSAIVSVKYPSAYKGIADAFAEGTGYSLVFADENADIVELVGSYAIIEPEAFISVKKIVPNKYIGGGFFPLVTADEKVFAYPFDAKVYGISYNSDILAAAGVDPASIKTWADFEKACQQVKFYGYTPVQMNQAGAEWFCQLYAITAFTEANKIAELKAGKVDEQILGRIYTFLDRIVSKGYVVESGDAAFTIAKAEADGNTIPVPSSRNDLEAGYVVDVQAYGAKTYATAAIAASLIGYGGDVEAKAVSGDYQIFGGSALPKSALAAISAQCKAILAK